MSRTEVDRILTAGELGTGIKDASDTSVDEFVLAYVCWREACTDVWRTDGLWSAAPAPERPLAFAAHGASLEREATAARVYARTASRLSQYEATAG